MRGAFLPDTKRRLTHGEDREVHRIAKATRSLAYQHIPSYVEARQEADSVAALINASVEPMSPTDV